VTTNNHYRKLERMYAAAPINDLIPSTLHTAEGRAEVIIPVSPDYFHAARGVHGSLYFKALDDAAFFAASSIIEDVFVLTASFTVQLLRPIAEGELRAVGKLIHPSRRLLTASSELKDHRGRIIATGSGVFLPSKIALTAELGYR